MAEGNPMMAGFARLTRFSAQAVLEGLVWFEGKLPIAPRRFESRLYERVVAVPYLPLSFASGFVSNERERTPPPLLALSYRNVASGAPSFASEPSPL